MEKQEVYKNLENVLEEEVKIYRLLLDAVRREKDFLIDSKIQELDENNKAKENMILKLRALDRQREEHAQTLGKYIGINTQTVPRLLELALKLEEPNCSKLRSIHATLELLITRIREYNDSNAALVNNALRTLDGALGIIKDNIEPRKPTYGQSGEVRKPESGAGHFVSKQV